MFQSHRSVQLCDSANPCWSNCEKVGGSFEEQTEQHTLRFHVSGIRSCVTLSFTSAEWKKHKNGWETFAASQQFLVLPHWLTARLQNKRFQRSHKRLAGIHAQLREAAHPKGCEGCRQLADRNTEKCSVWISVQWSRSKVPFQKPHQETAWWLEEKDLCFYIFFSYQAEVVRCQSGRHYSGYKSWG